MHRLELTVFTTMTGRRRTGRAKTGGGRKGNGSWGCHAKQRWSISPNDPRGASGDRGVAGSVGNPAI